MGIIFTPVFSALTLAAIILLLAALIPPIVMMVLVYRQDKIEKEPMSLIVKLIIFGCISVIPVYFLEVFAGRIIGFVCNTETMVYLVLSNFIGVALIEEGCKFIFLKAGSWRNREFNYRFDGIVYAVSVSLGFAAVENVMYVFNNGLKTAALRAVLSIPLHCICGIFMGHYYGEAKFAEVQGRAEKSRYLKTALILPLILHGFYDFALSTGMALFVVIFLVFVVVLDIVAFVKLRKYSREDIPFYQEEGFDHWRME